MAKEVACPMCGFRIRADSDNELVTHFAQHSKEMHRNEPSREQVLGMAKTVEVAAV
ncbi:MAG TPA: DUF1059 domain-containing protein [Candidatus Bathyarchaeia archaeon]|nr:DUF1059 domain-containing protein [Candidatus Bathyarchaeia archaeon]